MSIDCGRIIVYLFLILAPGTSIYTEFLDTILLLSKLLYTSSDLSSQYLTDDSPTPLRHRKKMISTTRWIL